MVKHTQTIRRQFADTLRLFAEVFKLSTTEKRDVSPADRLGFDDRFFDK